MITLLALSSNGLLMSSRVPQPLMLLGADGLPMKKAGNAPEKKIEVAGESSASGGAAFDKSLLVDSAKDEFSSGLASGVAPNIAIAGESEPAERKGAFTRDELPEDLKDFDPTFDPLAAPRPPLDFCAASGRPTECVFGAVAPESSEKMADWSTYIRDQGITRILGLFSAEDASARASDGTPQGKPSSPAVCVCASSSRSQASYALLCIRASELHRPSPCLTCRRLLRRPAERRVRGSEHRPARSAR